MNDVNKTEKTAMSKRMTLAFMAVLFFGPVIAAYVWFFYFHDAAPEASVNKGELVEPAVALTELELEPRGKDADTMPFSEDWTILVIAPGACDEACTQALVTTRQVWRRLNRDMDRVQRVLVASPEVDIDLSEHPVLRVYDYSAEFGAVIDEAMPQHTPESRVMLVDPFGNLMMSYPLDLEPEMLYDDLRRLLRYSQAG